MGWTKCPRDQNSHTAS